MSSHLDLDAYLARIGYAGPTAPTLDVLQKLHALHPAAITFENIDVLLQRPIRLEVAALADKMVTRSRGGYCYEQNTLLMAALQAIGFSVRTVAARVQWNQGDLVTARNHMVLLVSRAEGDYLADVGFGGLTQTAPLKLEHDTEQSTAHGSYRLIAVRDEQQVQARIDGEWRPMYQLSLADEAPSDWEMANWFVSTSPDSIFTNTLIVARPAEGRRYTLRNNRLRVHHSSGTTEQRVLATAAELREVLAGPFNLDLPPAREFAAILSIAGLSAEA